MPQRLLKLLLRKGEPGHGSYTCREADSPEALGRARVMAPIAVVQQAEHLRKGGPGHGSYTCGAAG